MRRYQKLSSFIVMDIVREAQKYDDCIHYEIGQPDTNPSPRVKATSIQAIQNSNFAYTSSKGLEELRLKISAHYKRVYNVDIDIERIIITPGTSTAFMMAYELLLDSGEKIGIGDPSYPCYKNFAYMASCEPIFIKSGKESDYIITPDSLQDVDIDTLHISSPSNPTGRVYRADELEELIEYCKSKDISFISDELYHGLVYDIDAPTALEFDENAIVINGFSKYFCMPGFRIGWIVVPPHLSRSAEIIAQNLYISAPTISQYAAIEAFDYDYLDSVRETFKARRDYLYSELSKIFEIDTKPEGAFYLWCDISKYSNSSVEFANLLLNELHIATTPGIDFGTNNTDKYLRFAYTRDLKHLKEGVERLKRFLSPMI